MRFIINSLIGICIFCLMAFSYPSKKVEQKIINTDCKILHEGVFYYESPKGKVKVIFKGKKHMEYHQGGKYFVKSKLKWVNDCEYNMTLKKTNYPNFPFKKGEIMNVKINKTDTNFIYYTATAKGESWESKFSRK